MPKYREEIKIGLTGSRNQTLIIAASINALVRGSMVVLTKAPIICNLTTKENIMYNYLETTDLITWSYIRCIAGTVGHLVAGHLLTRSLCTSMLIVPVLIVLLWPTCFLSMIWVSRRSLTPMTL